MSDTPSTSRPDVDAVPGAGQPMPVLFVHGLWIAASAWQPWCDLFASQGYAPVAPTWPGEADTIDETRAHPERQSGKGIAEVADHFAGVAESLPARPIVIGHSFGGLIAQQLLARGVASAAVAIDPAQIKGVKALPFAQLRSGFPVLGNPRNIKKAQRPTEGQFRYSFGNALTDHESRSLYERWTIPSPSRPLFQAALANFQRHSGASVDTARADRGPLLFISGADDHTVPAVVTRAAWRRYRKSPARTDYREVSRGHSLTIDAGWPEVAAIALAWLGEQGLSSSEAGTDRPDAGAFG